MLFGIRRKFLFRCEECKTILSVEFDDEEDIKNVEEDKVVLECPCGAHCRLLRD
jgi:RNase P subunit RPR2